MNGQMDAAPAVVQPGWWEQLQQKIDGQWLEQFDLSTQAIVEIAAYCGIGFLTGFLTKRYGRTLLVSIAGLGLLFWLLNYMHLISIHWPEVRALLGVEETATFDGFFQAITTWMRDHVRAVISSSVGFFVGYKAG